MLVRSTRWQAVVPFALALSAPVAARAQTPDGQADWRLTRYTTADRLPSDEVTHLAESARGTLWAGTARGLAWFDGWIWRAVPQDSGGLPLRTPQSIVAGVGDTMIVVSHNLLFVGDTTGFRKVPVVIGGIETQVRSAVATGNGILALVRREQEGAATLVLIRGDRIGAFEAPAPLGAHSAPRLFPSRDGGAWLNSERGLWRWDGQEWRLRFPTRGEPLAIALLREAASSGSGLLSITSPPSQAGLWAWESTGAFERQRTEGSLPMTAAAFGPQFDLVVHRGGHVRVRDRGVWRTPTASQAVFADANAALYDQRGDLWVGSGAGLWLVRSGSRLWRTHALGFPDQRDIVNALVPMTDGSTWAGTADGIIVRERDGRVRHIASVLGQPLGAVTGLARDSIGNVWASSGAGIDGALRWDGTAWRRFGRDEGLHADRIHDITVDRAGRVWFLGLSAGNSETGPGAFVLENERFIRWGVEEGLPSGRVYAFGEAPDGTRWFGTAGGLSRWRDGTWTHWSVRRGRVRGLSFKMAFRAFTLAVDALGRPWFGGGDAGDFPYGLGTITETDSLRFFNTSDGLIDDQVWAVAVGQDNTVWATTEGGVSAMRDGLIFNFGTDRGLGFSRVWPVMLGEDMVTLGTLGGGVRELRLDHARQPPPRVIVDATAVEGDRATVRWSTFAYRGTLPSALIETRYRVDEGAWSDWSTGRSATLVLRPGVHRFSLQAKGLFFPVESVSATAVVRVALPVLLRPLVAVPLAILSGALVALAWLGLRRSRDNNRERAQAQAALRASEERFATAFRASPDPVAIFTFPEGRIIEVNQGFEDVTGWGRADAIGRTCDDLALFEDVAVRDAIMRDLEQEGRVRNAECMLQTRQAGRRSVLVSSEVIRLAGQRHLLWVMTDVTEKRSLEAQLIHAQKMEAVGQLAGGIAHDFNNLLTAILGHAELLSDSLGDPASRADVHEIHRAASRAAELTSQLLMFARKRRSEPRVVSLNDLVGTTEKMLRRLVGEHFTMHTECGRHVPCVRMDPGHVEQMLVNLVVNARDAMPHGGTITVRTCTVVLDATTAAESADLRPGRYAELSVTDTGMGVPPELGDRIFEPFFTTKDVGKGTGLGLAICYGIAREAGGTITVSSLPGNGATFRILLPTVDSATDIIGATGNTDVGGGTETILLVEDEFAVRSLLGRVLREAGYTVHAAGDGPEALAVIEAMATPPDLLVTDVILPGRTGPEIARIARAGAPGLAVLYISGYTERSAGPAAAIDGPLLAKPFTRAALLRKVRDILDEAVTTAR